MAELRTVSEAGLKLMLETFARKFNFAIERDDAPEAHRIHTQASEVMGELLARMETAAARSR